ncbi:mitochondrial intermembrane space import and assembly protein 40-like isoform X1 [Thrips palmi]|uniref:Mitochondrial intermembrane space import and assembly protein 40-like isoform X1 n=1 Tax=Thrips palmi TaxID=161013 RepID=A0A6P8ZW70_THRPL|nr:mitochondrial intermembrane space import and assembly protein 40-like isoform X1 [Thrips palmi]
MSLCMKEGKDIIIFATKEDHDIPSKVQLPELEPQPGLIFPNGDINWNCPCLGGMATGPCGVEFREAFSCFHYSEADPKGSDCMELFKEMHSCMQEYPALYDNKDGKDDDDEGMGMGMNVEDANQSSTDQQPAKPAKEVAVSSTNEKN